MSNTLKPVALVPVHETPGVNMQEEASTELSGFNPIATTEAADVTSTTFGSLTAYAGDLVTKAAVYTQIKTWGAIDATTYTYHNAKNYLKREAGKIAAHTSLAALAITGGGLASFIETQSADAANGPQYTVAGTAAGGVYSRLTPHTADTPRIPGVGVYPGDVVTLKCGVTDGDPVGPYNNQTWHYVHDNSRPNEPDFWVNDHYLNTPNAANQLAPGETACPNESNNPLAATSQSGDQQPITSVFFSPISDQKNGLPQLPNVANVNYLRGDWSGASDCSDVKVNQLMQNLPSTVNTLAGWSEGRLGPIYYLAAATQEQKDRIHTIILFDPGNTSDFTNGSCDTNPKYDINTFLADWLRSNPANRLIIYTGLRSEEGNPGPYPQPFVEQLQDGTLLQQPYINNETFAGLWKYYLAGIWNQPFANQAQICDYNGMSHEDVLANFAYTVQHPISSCPVAADGQKPVAWNP